MTSKDSKLVVALLDKRMTDDGMFDIEDDVPIGKKYLVDLNSIRIMRVHNISRCVKFDCEMIYVIEHDSKYQEWMPTELLLILSE